MKVSVEISLYPLKDDFIPAIDRFLLRIHNYQELTVRVNGMSTQITGDYSSVMSALQEEMRITFEETGHHLFVMKVLKGDVYAGT